MATEIKVKVSTGAKLSVRSFWVTEGMSQLFQVDLVCTSEDFDLDLEGMLGNEASFTLDAGGPLVSPGVHSKAPSKRTWTGIVRFADQMRAEVKGESTYRIVIVPVLWLATQRRGNRIFQRKTLVDVIEHMLGEWNAYFEPRLEETYKKHEYIVQYGETDYAFICRLMEEAGISHSFTFKGGRTKVVLDDHPERGEPRPGTAIPYVASPNTDHYEHVHELQLFHEACSNKVTLKDYDFRRRPDYDLSAGASVQSPAGELEQYTYEPGGFLVESGGGGDTPVADAKGVYRNDDGEGKNKAERTMASIDATRRSIEFATNCVDLCPGSIFSVKNHPRQDLDQQMLVTDFTLSGGFDVDFRFEGTATFTDARWVPDAVTPKPRILGVQSARVVGGDGEIIVDEYGRVRVQFPWDREGKHDENSSCWIRVSQSWAGSAYGMLLLPRGGHEVLVGFLDGDPDQPLIVGRVYNSEAKVPYRLPEYKTRSTWKTQSPGGFNEIMLEDEKSLELMYMQAQLDLKKLVKEEETERTGKNRNLVVGRSSQEVIGKLDGTIAGKRHVIEMIRPPRCPKCGAPADPNSKTCTAVNPKTGVCGKEFEPPKDSDLHILDQDKPDVISLPTKIDMIEEQVIFTTGKASVVFKGKDLYFEADKDITFKAQNGEMFIEGKMVYVNTTRPGPAPKPKKLDPMEPGCFKGEKTDP